MSESPGIYEGYCNLIVSGLNRVVEDTKVYTRSLISACPVFIVEHEICDDKVRIKVTYNYAYACNTKLQRDIKPEEYFKRFNFLTIDYAGDAADKLEAAYKETTRLLFRIIVYGKGALNVDNIINGLVPAYKDGFVDGYEYKDTIAYLILHQDYFEKQDKPEPLIK